MKIPGIDKTLIAGSARCRRDFLCRLFFIACALLLSPLSYAEELRDVKPPVDIPGLAWLIWLIAALVIGTAGCWLWLRLRRHRKPVVAVIKKPWELAQEELLNLERQNLFAQGKVKEYFSALSDILRHYIERRFDIHAPEMTTEEFLNSVKSNLFIDAKQQGLLKRFLTLSDMVKFAKYGPDASEALESFQVARHFVMRTKVEETSEGLDDPSVLKDA